MSAETLNSLRETIERLCEGQHFEARDRAALEAAARELENCQVDHFVAPPDSHDDAGREGWVEVRDHVRVHLIAMHTGRGPRGWLSTYGMRELGFAELEIRDVPMFMFGAAGALLNSVCAYIVNGDKPVLEGQTMQEGSRYCIFQFKQLAPISADQAEHYEHPRWCLVDPPGIEGRCDVRSGRVASA